MVKRIDEMKRCRPEDSLYMERKARKTEYKPKFDEKMPIPFEKVKAYLKSRHLGNYVNEVCQELVIRFLSAGKGGAPKSVEYAFGILRNIASEKCRQIAKDKNLRKRLETRAKADSRCTGPGCPDEWVETKEECEEIQKLMVDLPLREKVAFNLDMLGYTYREIGKIIGMSPSTARLDSKRAMKFIQRRIDNGEHKQ